MAEQMGAAEVFGNDMYVVSGLLGKLASTSVDKWIEYAEGQPTPVVTGVNEWAIFRQWLLSCYKMAKRARLTAQQAPRTSAPSAVGKSPVGGTTTSKAGIICSRCREKGH